MNRTHQKGCQPQSFSEEIDKRGMWMFIVSQMTACERCLLNFSGFSSHVPISTPMSIFHSRTWHTWGREPDKWAGPWVLGLLPWLESKGWRPDFYQSPWLALPSDDLALDFVKYSWSATLAGTLGHAGPCASRNLFLVLLKWKSVKELLGDCPRWDQEDQAARPALEKWFKKEKGKVD